MVPCISQWIIIATSNFSGLFPLFIILCCISSLLDVPGTEIEDLTGRLCWELVAKEGYIAIWRKPLNNTCYLARNPDVQPPICDANDDPDNVWYAMPLYFIT